VQRSRSSRSLEARLGLDEGDPRPHDPSVGLGKDGDGDGFRFCPCFEIRS
jgi:hypothetical protein